MTLRQRLVLILLVAAVALTRFAFRSHYLYDVDSVHFALAMNRFDPTTYQPQPPGYFLYCCLGEFMQLLFRDANASLVAISIAASCGAVVMIYLLASEWFGARAALWAGLVFLFSPLAWFHGVVALTYIVEAFFSAAVGYACWRAYRGKTIWLFGAAVLLGVSGGLRPSSLLLLGPLLLLCWYHAPRKQVLASAGLLVVTVLAWFIPMVLQSGGIHTYFAALSSLWRVAGNTNTIYNSSPVNSIARLFTVLFIIALCSGSALLFSAAALRKARTAGKHLQIFTTVWMIPALSFFTFVFLMFVNSGYLLIVLPPLCIWLGAGLSTWYAETSLKPGWKLALVSMAMTANTAIFLAAPLYCSYRSVRSFETELVQATSAVAQVALPNETLIVGFDSHFLGYRHAGYYLPAYTTVQYPEQKDRVFIMLHADTRVIGDLQEAGFRNFLLFPLPLNDTSYQKYALEVQNKLPRSDLRIVRASGRDLVTAPIGDLRYLFPKTARSGMYTE
jgi:4-amino-4-deoxy-L-arabinose transferase-like glycosyltransferase